MSDAPAFAGMSGTIAQNEKSGPPFDGPLQFS